MHKSKSALTRTILCGLVFSGFAQIASAADEPMAVQTVVGRNDPTLDVLAVQKAVDQGGTVLLKGEFNFGDKGNVTITKDVKLIGDVDDKGSPRTTIKGGQATLRSLRPEAFTVPGPKITVQHIHFDGASWMPIQVSYASGATITGNRITHVRPLPHAVTAWKPYSMQQGMVLGTFMSQQLDKQEGYQADAVSGTVTISDNEIDLVNDTPKTTMGQAIFLMRTTGVSANIARNTIRNVSRNAIEVLDNFRGSDGKGQITIQDNNIETPLEGVPVPSPSTPNGIVFGYFLDKAAAIDAKRTIQHAVIHNKVWTRGQTSIGIMVMMNDALVRDNHVSVEGQGALAIYVGGAHNYVGQNLMVGSGRAGLVLAPYPPMSASDNELAGNEFGQLKTVVADVALMKGANNNLLSGSKGSVNDLGLGNQIGELKPIAAVPAK